MNNNKFIEVLLDETQKEAVSLCSNFNKRIVGVTGQAGTGKTTIMREAYKEAKQLGKNPILVSLFGKAARRIQEATGIKAMTIHRLLEYPKPNEICPKTGKALLSTEPKRDKSNPIEYDVVLADEYSVVGQELHRNLLDALPLGGCIRMFGDINQLQPIEQYKVYRNKPSAFKVILNRFPLIKLEYIFRQNEDSSIISNANRIKRGFSPQRKHDFDIKLTNNPVDVIKEIIVKTEDFFHNDYQIISPGKLSWVGTNKLNTLVQLYNPLINIEKKIIIERHIWAKDFGLTIHVNDKVIVTQNLHELNVFNGESGIVKNISYSNEIEIDFGDRTVLFPTSVIRNKRNGTTYQYNPQKDLSLGYVITTHKSQGSEYKEVMYVINKSTIYNQNRANFYTAITRAKEKVHLITDNRSLISSVMKEERYG